MRALLISTLVAVGCGGGGGAGGGSCGAPSCGGDVVGRWVVDTACLDQAALTSRVLGSYASCSGASLGDVAPMPYGEVTFAGDSTFTMSLGMDLVFKIDIPRSCFNGGTCSAGDSDFMENLIGNVGVGSVACGGDQACTCNQVGTLNFGQSQDVQAVTGTYSLSGGTLSLMSSTGVTDGGPYCVQGSALHLALSGMSSGMSVIQSNLVFTKM